MTDRKRLLGLDRSITRRDFVNVAGVGIAASAFMRCGSQDSISEGSLAADPWSDHLGPEWYGPCLLYTSPSPRDLSTSRMPSSA